GDLAAIGDQDLGKHDLRVRRRRQGWQFSRGVSAQAFPAGPGAPTFAPMSTTSPYVFDLTPPSEAERKRLEADLSPEEADVLLHHGTEAPFCGGLLAQKEDGVYGCRLCGLPLFRHSKK